MAADSFSGPVFVVGKSRSGTKLLGALLDNHPRVAIPNIASRVIPYFHRREDEYGDLAVRENFRRFFDDFRATYFVRQLEEQGFVVDEAEWFAAVGEPGLPGVLAAYFRLYTARMGKDVWGDRTPTYMLHLPLLSRMYPQARFVHIVRDVRDMCLSVRKAWGKNIFRAAQRWADDNEACVDAVEQHGLHERYLRVHYEALIGDPASCLAEICQFLSLDFAPGMERLARPAEQVGDARGTDVVATNAGKWRTQFTPQEIARIEALTGPTLARLGYLDGDPGRQPRKRLGRLRMFAYKAADAVNLFRSHHREHGGTRNVIHFMYTTYRQRSSQH